MEPTRGHSEAQFLIKGELQALNKLLTCSVSAPTNEIGEIDLTQFVAWRNAR